MDTIWNLVEDLSLSVPVKLYTVLKLDGLENLHFSIFLATFNKIQYSIYHFRYYSPGYSESLLDRVEAYTPQVRNLMK